VTPFELFLENIIRVDVWGAAKLLYLLFMLIYLGFAVVVFKQVWLMINVFNGSLNLPLKAIALIHLILAILVLLLVLVVL
jgi:hypothetical protein